MQRTALVLCLYCLCVGWVRSETVQAAVAANFRPTLEMLAPRFQQRHRHRLSISGGSSGSLYAQIVHGAPYDVFLAADSFYPARLERAGLAVKGSRFTYAAGILVLVYRPELAAIAEEGISRLLEQPHLTVAIAHPKLAPYGAAGQQVLSRFQTIDRHLVSGANINQTFQMWRSGGADIALVAASQAQPPFLSVPEDWYGGLEQQAVILRDARPDSPAAVFMGWLGSAAVRGQIAAAGYRAGTP